MWVILTEGCNKVHKLGSYVRIILMRPAGGKCL